MGSVMGYLHVENLGQTLRQRNHIIYNSSSNCTIKLNTLFLYGTICDKHQKHGLQ